MSTVKLLVALMVVALVSSGMTGCKQKQSEAPAEPVTEEMVEEAAPEVEHPEVPDPAEAKPKDHPAH